MDSVQVAVRVRPLVQHEIENGCRSCLEVVPELQQIVTKMRNDRFTFNYVFDSDTPQIDVYETAVQNLVQQLFKGYNVTILAYGQTGSGKTYSMGTCPSSNPTEEGIIQRAVVDMFAKIESDEEWMFNVSVSFLELYNEQLIDLLCDRPSTTVELREVSRDIVIPGLTQKSAHTAQEVLQCLRKGSENRTTGATAMNAQSSRSHAIFTIYIRQTRRSDEDEAMSAKFHLVDLAGSERSKKTKAEGKRFLEGVNINKELFVLGNVISSLCDGAPFVNYRNSKLTRLLQDSLGGNALTLMLACVSPADSNLDETINTMRYADRARKIKNKPIVNQDPTKQEINRLKQTIEEQRLQIVSNQVGRCCPPEHEVLLEKNNTLIEKNRKLGSSLDSALLQTSSLLDRLQTADAARDRLTVILSNLDATFNNTITGLDSSLNEDQKTNLNMLKVLMEELQTENEKNETERMKYEEQLRATPECLILDDQPCNEEREQEIEEIGREEFVLRQASHHKEIQELDKEVAWKELYAVKLAESNSLEGTILKVINEEDISDLKAQINNLIHEKEELEKEELQNQHSSNIDDKLAEQRRKRLKELEDKITVLNTKVVDQDRVIKMKEQNEERIKNLKNEIMSMKQRKVRLINLMKIDGEIYRYYRVSREQEVCKLRQQNRQKEIKFVKMESFYMRQQNVYKRKLEESAAVIRKLKDTLALQQINAKDKETLLGNADSVNQWVNQEFSTLVSTVEAERTLENLKEDRALMSKEILRLKKLLVPKLEEEEKSKIMEQIKCINEDVELRSTQILDLTNKLQSLESYQENKSKNPYECVQTMADANEALKYIFETAHNYLSELHKDKAAKDSDLQELRESYKALQAQMEEKEDLLKEANKKHKKTLSELKEKMIMLLKRLQDGERDSSSTDLLRDITKVLEDESSSGSVKDKLEKNQLQQRIQELEQMLEEQNSKKPKEEEKNSDCNAAITPETRRKIDDPEVKVIDFDDPNTDPDWKRTPIFKWLRRLSKQKLGVKRNLRKKKVGVKKNLDGQPFCSCEKNCLTKICSCKKVGNYCTGTCTCNDDACRNKEPLPSPSISNPKDESLSDDSDILFKKPRLTGLRFTRKIT